MTSLDRPTVATIPVVEGLVPQGVEVSPDGERLLYPATDGSSYKVPEFYLYDLTTSQTRRLTDIPLESAWWWSLQSTFSSDGRTVLYDLPRSDGELTGWDVWAVPVAGGPATRVVRDAKGPRAIPGTTDLAVLTPRELLWEGSAIEIVTASGARRTIVEATSGIGPIQASPDGKRLAYTEDATGAWVIDIGTGHKTHVGDGGVGAWVDDQTLLILP
jgi:Tol biopolymer transport system component